MEGWVKWTITNVYQSLTFRASVVGFNQPVFRWWINGQPQNQFNADAFGEVTVSAEVVTDAQLAPPKPVAWEPVKLSIGAFHAASYDANGTYGSLAISPTAVQGHIVLTVVVEVCDLSAAGMTPIPAAEVSQQTSAAMLNTQVLTWGQI
jgi:hypothetical protein